MIDVSNIIVNEQIAILSSEYLKYYGLSGWSIKLQGYKCIVNFFYL